MAEFFGHLDGMRSVAYYVDSDFDNLEEVFSLLEMGKQLGDNQSVDQIARLRWSIYETLDATTRVRMKEGKQIPDSVYMEFVNQFKKLNEERRTRARTPSLGTVSDTIVTFNYDVLLDHALEAGQVPVTYGLLPDREDGVQLLKLHGSLNWGVCTDCNGAPQIVSPSSDAWIGTPRLDPLPGANIELRLATKILPGTKCRQCGRTDRLEPVMVPPTWSKLIAGSPLVPVWTHAVEALKTAYQVIIVGYSMPTTDTFLRYLFALGLRANPWFSRVVVVNPDKSAGFRSRYEAVFGRALGSRGKLIFVDQVNFEDFVSKGEMGRIGRNM
jgi:hypothetical protein